MGCHDIFCPICGIPLGYNIIDSIKKNGFDSYNIKYSKWSNQCTLLLLGKAAKHGFVEIACNIVFSNNKEEILVGNIFEGDSEKFGIVMHTDCWKFACRILSRKLVLDDFDMKKIAKYSTYMFTYLKNKELSQYHGQDFDLESDPLGVALRARLRLNPQIAVFF